MSTWNIQAESLNQVIVEKSPHLFELLSKKGKGIYFPYAGILGQGAAAKSVKYNATVGIAKEDDNTPMRLSSLAGQTDLAPGKVFPYAPSFGNPDLRKQWKEMLVQKNSGLQGKSFSNPVVTQALTHGLSLAGFLFLDEGEDVLVPNPYWDNYNLLFEEGLGSKVASFECFEDNTRFNLKALESVLEERVGKKSVLLLNFPNNPTGYTPSTDELASISSMLKDYAEKGSKLVVLIDDAYFGLVYEDGVATESIFATLCDAHENILAVKIDGATKEDYVWGFRVGFITFGSKGCSDEVYKAFADKAGGAIRGMISNCAQVSQSMLLQAYTSDTYAAEKEEKYNTLKGRYEEIKAELANHPEYAEEFEPLPYNSGYFMCVVPKGGLDVEEVRKVLIEKYDTGVIALEGYIRVAFSCLPAEFIPAVFDNLYQACKEVRGA